VKNVRQLADSAGGRRFVLTIGTGLVCSFLVWFGKITSGDFAMIIIGTVAVYIGGNTYQKTKRVSDEPAGG
jgi:hypothetical protein